MGNWKHADILIKKYPHMLAERQKCSSFQLHSHKWQIEIKVIYSGVWIFYQIGRAHV